MRDVSEKDLINLKTMNKAICNLKLRWVSFYVWFSIRVYTMIYLYFGFLKTDPVEKSVDCTLDSIFNNVFIACYSKNVFQ